MNTYHIYAVVSRETNDAYVGTTRRLGRRWQEHQWQLKSGKHPAKRLQAAWNASGPEAFEFVIIWTAVDSTKDGIKAAELYWIESVGTYNDLQADVEAGKFKMLPEARVKAGIRNKARGATPEYRATMAEHARRRWADPELRKGFGHGKKFTKGPDGSPRKTPEMNAANGVMMKELWADPEHRAKRAANIKAERWKDPDAKAKHAERMRKQHADRRAAKNGATLI